MSLLQVAVTIFAVLMLLSGLFLLVYLSDKKAKDLEERLKTK